MTDIGRLILFTPCSKSMILEEWRASGSDVMKIEEPEIPRSRFFCRFFFFFFCRRWMMLVTTVALNLADMPFSFCTIFDVVRNQYFYLGETVLIEIPAAANFVVATFVIVEMAEGGNEQCRNRRF